MARKRIPKPPEEVDQPIDARVEKEKEAFKSDTYEEKSKASEHSRSESVKWVLHWVAVAIFLTFAASYLLFLAVWAYHLLVPLEISFLNASQVDKLQSIVLSGIVASALSKYYEKYMK